MGQTWHAPAGAPRPAHRMGLYLRRDLSREGERRRAGHALVRHRRHGGAPHRDQCRVDPGAHAVLIVDQAGWHLTPKLAIPDNITVLALPPRSPELNPVENVWQFMRDNWLSNRIFQILRRHRRAVLPSLEQPHRPTMEDHVPRHAQMGAWVLINDRWYKIAKLEAELDHKLGKAESEFEREAAKEDKTEKIVEKRAKLEEKVDKAMQIRRENRPRKRAVRRETRQDFARATGQLGPFPPRIFGHSSHIG